LNPSPPLTSTLALEALAAAQVSMGLESDRTAWATPSGSDKYGFIDVYGSAFGRDIEPTVVRPPSPPCLPPCPQSRAVHYVMHGWEAKQQDVWPCLRAWQFRGVRPGPHLAERAAIDALRLGLSTSSARLWHPLSPEIGVHDRRRVAPCSTPSWLRASSCSALAAATAAGTPKRPAVQVRSPSPANLCALPTVVLGDSWA
jgi:hypothetical protein